MARLHFIQPVVLALAMTACGVVQLGTDRPPPPTPGQDLIAWLVDLPGHAGHEFHIRNDSQRIYRITGVTLTDCNNIRECGSHEVDVVICPGEARQVFRSHPASLTYPVERLYFNWDYRSTSYEPGEPVVGANCDQEER